MLVLEEKETVAENNVMSTTFYLRSMIMMLVPDVADPDPSFNFIFCLSSTDDVETTNMIMNDLRNENENTEDTKGKICN